LIAITGALRSQVGSLAVPEPSSAAGSEAALDIESLSHIGWAKLKLSVQSLVSGQELPAPAPPIPKLRGRFHPLGWWAAGALTLLVIGSGLLLTFGHPTEDRKPIIAVLPFTSLDQSNESLVAGMWEDTRHALSTNPNLLVLGPNTSEELAKKDTNATRKAADYVLQASVRSVGDRIRISTGLVRTVDGAEVWNEAFDRKLDDVFALQSEIASDIEGRIRGRLAKGKGTQPQNIATTGEVYALYSDGRAKLRKRQMARYGDAYDELEQVVQRDPNFAPGWATLAILKQFGAATDLRQSKSSPEADARRAIALAPNLATAHAALGFVLGQGPVAQAELRKAIALDPNDFEAMNWLAATLDQRTEVEAKLRLYDRIVEIEPLWWPAVLNKVALLTSSGDARAADAELARLEKLGEKRMVTAFKMNAFEMKGDLSSATRLGLDAYRNAKGEEREFIANTLWQPLIQLGYFQAADRLSPPPPGPMVPLLRRNDPHALDIIEASMPPARFWTSGPLPTVGGRVYLLNRQGPRLAKLYRAVAANPEQFKAIVGRDRLPEIAPTAALALRSVGDADQARQLLTLAEGETGHVAGSDLDQQVLLARIYAVEGRSAEAIATLSSAIGAGWLPPYLPIPTDLGLDPPFAELKTQPRFEQLRQQVLGQLAKERAELGVISLN
jgi:TolB-like protein/Flp pilus assembly protein TadD